VCHHLVDFDICPLSCLQLVYDDGDEEQLVLGAVVSVKLKRSTLEASPLPSGQQLVQLAGVLLDLAAAAEVEAAATTGKPASRRKKEKEGELVVWCCLCFASALPCIMQVHCSSKNV